MYRILPAAGQPEAKAKFEQFFGVKPGLFLVRPDSYLGFVGGQSDWPSLTQWLNRWLPLPDMPQP